MTPLTPSERFSKYFDVRINLGTIFLLGAAILGFIAGYTRLQDEVAGLRQELAAHKAQQMQETVLYMRKDAAR